MIMTGGLLSLFSNLDSLTIALKTLIAMLLSICCALSSVGGVRNDLPKHHARSTENITVYLDDDNNIVFEAETTAKEYKNWRCSYVSGADIVGEEFVKTNGNNGVYRVRIHKYMPGDGEIDFDYRSVDKAGNKISVYYMLGVITSITLMPFFYMTEYEYYVNGNLVTDITEY